MNLNIQFENFDYIKDLAEQTKKIIKSNKKDKDGAIYLKIREIESLIDILKKDIKDEVFPIIPLEKGNYTIIE